MYDTNGGGSGLGSYSLMGNSWGFDGSQYHPPALDPWCKLQLGWISPTVLSSYQTGISLEPSYTKHKYYRIDMGYPNKEYLLIENRRKIGFDSALKQVNLRI